MIEKPSPLCPEDCLFNGLPGCSDCKHSRDVIFKNPEEVEVRWYRNIWRKANIIGRADDTLYVKEEGDEGITTLPVKSSNIR